MVNARRMGYAADQQAQTATPFPAMNRLARRFFLVPRNSIFRTSSFPSASARAPAKSDVHREAHGSIVVRLFAFMSPASIQVAAAVVVGIVAKAAGSVAEAFLAEAPVVVASDVVIRVSLPNQKPIDRLAARRPALRDGSFFEMLS